MSVKLVLLKSGEDIISDVQEMCISTDTDEKVIGYIFNKPCVINVKSPEIIVETDEMSAQKKLEIKLFPWIPLSKDNKIPVPTDWVVTMIDPIDQVKTMYENEVLSSKNKDD